MRRIHAQRTDYGMKKKAGPEPQEQEAQLIQYTYKSFLLRMIIRNRKSELIHG